MATSSSTSSSHRPGQQSGQSVASKNPFAALGEENGKDEAEEGEMMVTVDRGQERHDMSDATFGKEHGKKSEQKKRKKKKSGESGNDDDDDGGNKDKSGVMDDKDPVRETVVESKDVVKKGSPRQVSQTSKTDEKVTEVEIAPKGVVDETIISDPLFKRIPILLKRTSGARPGDAGSAKAEIVQVGDLAFEKMDSERLVRKWKNVDTKLVAFFFGAAWSDGKDFASTLHKIHLAFHSRLPVVYVSVDTTPDEFAKYVQERPWYSLPLDDEEDDEQEEQDEQDLTSSGGAMLSRAELAMEARVIQIPHLAIYNLEAQRFVEMDATSLVQSSKSDYDFHDKQAQYDTVVGRALLQWEAGLPAPRSLAHLWRRSRSWLLIIGATVVYALVVRVIAAEKVRSALFGG